MTYTGTSDVLTYENNTGDETEIFLWYKTYKKISKGIPAPLYYWKVLYYQSMNQGVAFLGMNDPHSEDVTDYLCPNQCNKLSWLKKYVPDVELEEKGHMTCCTIADLSKVVPVVGTFEDEAGNLIKDAELMKKVPE